jgi:hypothetical protein
MGGPPDLERRLMLRRAYGAGPMHLAAMAAFLALTGYALYAIFQNAEPWAVLLYLGAAVIAHDFVLMPLYTGLWWLATRAGGRAGPRRRAIAFHLAVPAALSGLLLLTWLPLVLRLSEGAYRPTTGMTQEPYLGRWLALTAGLFAVSALVYAVRARRATGR